MVKNTVVPQAGSVVSGRRLLSEGFTLIELLVVVAIIAILAAIAVPNFLEAQTRAKVSVAQNNLRVVAGGLEAYRVDNNGYPGMRSVPPADPFGLLADHQLAVLTTPIAYLSPSSLRDPFGVIQQRFFATSRGSLAQSSNSGTDLPIPTMANPGKSLLYYHYRTFAQVLQAPIMNREASAIVSIGPDARDSYSVYAPFPSVFPASARQLGFNTGLDTLYDPTNGTVSEGDLIRFVGNLWSPAQP